MISNLDISKILKFKFQMDYQLNLNDVETGNIRKKIRKKI